MSEASVFAVTVALGVVAGILAPSRTGARGRVWNAIVGAVAGAALTTLFMILITLQAVQRHLDDEAASSRYLRVTQQLAQVSNRAPLIDTRRRKLKALDRELELLYQGTVSLPSSAEVVGEWLDQIRKAKQEILATNVVRPGIWLQNAELRGPGRDAQKHAIESDSPVTIRRIWIYSAKDEASQEALLAVSLDQRSYGIQVRYLTTEELYAQPFIAQYEQVLGSIDLVLFDGGSILLTTTDPNDHSILSGFITTDPERIQSGRELFSRLWSIAQDKFHK